MGFNSGFKGLTFGINLLVRIVQPKYIAYLHDTLSHLTFNLFTRTGSISTRQTQQWTN